MGLKRKNLELFVIFETFEIFVLEILELLEILEILFQKFYFTNNFILDCKRQRGFLMKIRQKTKGLLDENTAIDKLRLY